MVKKERTMENQPEGHVLKSIAVVPEKQETPREQSTPARNERNNNDGKPKTLVGAFAKIGPEANQRWGVKRGSGSGGDRGSHDRNNDRRK